MQTKSLLTTIATASVTATASAALPAASFSDMACAPVPQQSQCSSFPVRHITLTAMSLQTLSADIQPFSNATEWNAYLESLQTSETALDAHLKSVFGCKSHEHLHMDPSAITSQLCLAARGSSMMCVDDAVDDTPVCASFCAEMEAAFRALLSDARICPTENLSPAQITNRIQFQQIAAECSDTISRIWPNAGASCRSISLSGSGKYLLRQRRASFTNPLKGKVALDHDLTALKPKFSNFLQKAADERNPNGPIEHFLDQKNVNLQAAPGELGNTGPSSTGGLSTGAIVGIVIGCVAAGIAIVFGLIALLRKPSSKVKRSESDHLIPNRAPFSTLASYNNRGGVPTDYSPLTEGIDMRERAPKARPKLLGRQSVVLEYTASQPDELSVKKGDILILQEYKQDGWGEGVLERTGARGVFPLVCVGIVEPPATA
ncbi:hypothetical protein HDU77_004991 [Chytriomyces hyalinus]|nr:hypothetical protein HDU77_004991 [Chytriomyces hyalinus]